jgi:hypothetical protein
MLEMALQNGYKVGRLAGGKLLIRNPSKMSIFGSV